MYSIGVLLNTLLYVVCCVESVIKGVALTYACVLRSLSTVKILT